MWPRRDLLDLLGIEQPIIQAPMANSATPALAAAVGNAGGLGSLGCAAMSLDELRTEVGELRAATNQPFSLNFFAHDSPKENADVDALTRKRLAPFYLELGLGEVPAGGPLPFGSFDADTLAALLEIEPAVVSFHFGLPAPEAIAALKDAGCRLLCSATSVAEAESLAAAGVDAIVAQGWEAGGHRGTFDISFEDVGVGTMALVPQIVDAVDVPVIAAGGIADGRGIAAAFALGASGVQMSTAFLSCPEAQVSETHRNALRHASDQDTRLTRAFSGRPARARNNRYIDATNPLRQAAAAADDPNFQFLLYGQAAALNRELPAAELVETLVAEAQEVLGRR